jgi:GNAT superfamily N-acetyltransferase
MSARVRVMGIEDLDALPDRCRGCMAWQTPVRGLVGPPQDPSAQDAWWQAVQLEWGAPGRAVWHDDRIVGFAVFAPPVHLGRLRTIDPAADEDSLVLATAWIDPGHRRSGLATHLVQVIAREAIAHGHAAVEAYASTDPADPTQPGRCRVPSAFLERTGFSLHRPHPTMPLYRLDVARTARWTESVGSRWGEVVKALSGQTSPRGERARNV